MKKLVSIFLCLVMAVFMAIPTAAEKSSLFDINPDSVDTIRIRMGWGGGHTLDAAQNAELIHEIIRTLNDFEYKGTVDLSDYSGWYAALDIIDKDGTVQKIEIGVDGAFDPNSSKRIKYISIEPDYFGENWLKLFFPYPFTDVNMWETPHIKGLYDIGLMQGTSDTTFSPDTVMTRGMFVTVLGRMAEVRADDYRETVFADVPETDYFFPFVSWAVQKGIMKGTSAKTFSPKEPVTREQAAVILVRFAEAYDLEFLSSNITYRPSFTEIQEHLTDIENTSKEFQENYPALYAAYILHDKDGRNIFDPTGTLTRKEAAEVLAVTYGTLYDM